MPDILIRGMKMPENEPLRIVLNPNGQLFVCHSVTFTEYEAIELPEHGDLIDRDAILHEDVLHYVDTLNSSFGGSYVKFSDLLRGAPVIVPSNKEETE